MLPKIATVVVMRRLNQTVRFKKKIIIVGTWNGFPCDSTAITFSFFAFFVGERRGRMVASG